MEPNPGLWQRPYPGIRLTCSNDIPKGYVERQSADIRLRGVRVHMPTAIGTYSDNTSALYQEHVQQYGYLA